ncbi:hypothetical protein [Streptomyces armeniacus]|uniref:hypothetical protein n=1 Tax=Streptomyces armeniacus TaxID=83291 RepID=UPI001AD83318|nr:hypothetical protein [Streptomyces armeniacus]
MTAVLLFLIVAIVLGIVGWVVEGLFWLFILGVLLFMADLVFSGVLIGRGRGMRSHR